MSNNTSADSTSILKAIDGSYLKWQDFRKDVLLPFGISIIEGTIVDRLPPTVLARLQERLPSLPGASSQAEGWQAQVAAGQGFNANSTIFPPNLLPMIANPTKVQRGLSPKMSREGLPRRTRFTQDSIFELPHAKPLLASAFMYEAFSDIEHRGLPNAMLPAGTCIDFERGKVMAGRLMPCPFLVFEHCPSMKDDDIESALNMCALSGTQCVKGIRDILRGEQNPHNPIENAFAFSCAINDHVAVISSHLADDKGHYSMSALCRFDLEKNDHLETFSIWIRAIEEWAAECLLPCLRDALKRVPSSGDTPPASPMPSLTLSIDTLRGSMPTLMRALRSTYPAIKWQTDEVAETPIMSSVAACGTPWEGRRLQSLALGSASPAGGPLSLMARRRHNSGSVLPPLQTRGTAMYAPPRPSPLSPRYATSLDMDWDQSPCRPGTLSPCTPAPDMPWTAQSPMLVLRKRVDVAMDEIQELRRQMESLQSELEHKTKQLKEQLSINTNLNLQVGSGDLSTASTPVPIQSHEKQLVNMQVKQNSIMTNRHILLGIILGLVLLVLAARYDLKRSVQISGHSFSTSEGHVLDVFQGLEQAL